MRPPRKNLLDPGGRALNVERHCGVRVGNLDYPGMRFQGEKKYKHAEKI